MTENGMNLGKNDILAKLKALEKGTLYVAYCCQDCGQRFKTADQGEETTCPVCKGVAKRVATVGHS